MFRGATTVKLIEHPLGEHIRFQFILLDHFPQSRNDVRVGTDRPLQKTAVGEMIITNCLINGGAVAAAGEEG